MPYAYLSCKVVQFLAPIVDEFVYVDYLLPVDSSFLQFPHECGNIPDFLVQTCLGTV